MVLLCVEGAREVDVWDGSPLREIEEEKERGRRRVKEGSREKKKKLIKGGKGRRK
jgi:hypothetical protein